MKIVSRLLLTLFVVGAFIGTDTLSSCGCAERMKLYLAKRPQNRLKDYVLGKRLSYQKPQRVYDLAYGHDGRRIWTSGIIYRFGSFLGRNPEVFPTFDQLAAQQQWFERMPIFTLCRLASIDGKMEAVNLESKAAARIAQLPAKNSNYLRLPIGGN